MSQKSLIWIGMFLGSTVGSFIPLLWGAGMLSMSSILLSGAGALFGVWLGWKLGDGL